MKKKKPTSRRRVKAIASPPQPPAVRRSAKVSAPLDFFVGTPQIKWRLVESARQIGAAAMTLSLNRAQGKGLELPAEKLLHDLLDAIRQIRSFTERSPRASLMTLAAEADEMWESLRLCERIRKLASNLSPWVIRSPQETLNSVCKDARLRKRLPELLREKEKANESDLEWLIPLLPEVTQKHIKSIEKNVQRPSARFALALVCADFLRERDARYREQQRLLNPLYHFFDALDEKKMLLAAGLIPEAVFQWHKKARKYYSEVMRKRKSRSEQKEPPAKV